MLSKELEFTLNLAFKEAQEKKHEFITVEHLLLALLDNLAAVDVLRACGANMDELRSELTRFIDGNIPELAVEDIRDIQPTLGFQRVMQRTLFHVQAAGKDEATGANVLVAIFNEQESQAVFFLGKQDITRFDVVNYIAHGISKLHEEGSGEESHPTSEDDEVAEHPGGASPLDSFATNLNEMAQQGKIDPLIGRKKEVERTIQILCRRRKNNPLFVGEAGVGKTALAEGLAKKIVDGEVPEVLAPAVIYSLDLGALLAGTKYRGDFEKRIKVVLGQLKKEPEAVLFIDEIHTIIGAGSASGGVMDASNLIKPMLASGELRCIGSTTYQEYRSIFEKDRALARRFQKIDVTEPTVSEAVQILEGLKPRYESHHEVKYSSAALRSAAELAHRHLSDRYLPDTAIDVIDEVGASQQLLPLSRRKKNIGVKDIEAIVANIARIPPKQVSSSDIELLGRLEHHLKQVIFGQDEAIATLATAIKMARSGLGEEHKPIGSFLFAGPTGVGKTELTRQLATTMGIELVRFDMSEYMERHTVSRLIGAPPGYVGYDQGGLLTEAINKHPYAVLLLDEIEKAHPDVFNLLLQVMDHGTLTDNNGRKTDFRNVIIVMTTNAGAEQMSRPSIGFSSQDHSSDGMEAIRRSFTPEFRNRLDAVIQFNSLDEKTIGSVVDKLVAQIEAQLMDKHVALNVDDKARAWLAQHGYDKSMGARPMSRLLQDHLKKKLADELLFGKLAQGGEVNISAKDDELIFAIKPREQGKNQKNKLNIKQKS